MMEAKKLWFLIAFALLASTFGTLTGKYSDDEQTRSRTLRRRRQLLLTDPRSVDLREHHAAARSNVEYKGISNAQWCRKPETDEIPAPEIDFNSCPAENQILRLDVFGGMCAELNKVLKTALWAYTDGMCLYVDQVEGKRPFAKLGYRGDSSPFINNLLDRYFVHMGLSKAEYKHRMRNHESALVISPELSEINTHEFSQHGGYLSADHEMRYRPRSIESLGYNEVDSISLKKHFLRRLFRIKEKVMHESCARLSAHPGLESEYIALSVRRGDKEKEFKLIETAQPYIEKAEHAAATHFDGIVPAIFVATDDCNVMAELREARPMWHFVSECDNLSDEVNGFVFKEMKDWTEEQTDTHFHKFITELIALASAKYFIGVSTTNVTYWVYFMRHLEAYDDTFELVDRPSDFKPW